MAAAAGAAKKPKHRKKLGAPPPVRTTYTEKCLKSCFECCLVVSYTCPLTTVTVLVITACGCARASDSHLWRILRRSGERASGLQVHVRGEGKMEAVLLVAVLLRLGSSAFRTFKVGAKLILWSAGRLV